MWWQFSGNKWGKHTAICGFWRGKRSWQKQGRAQKVWRKAPIIFCGSRLTTDRKLWLLNRLERNKLGVDPAFGHECTVQMQYCQVFGALVIGKIAHSKQFLLTHLQTDSFAPCSGVRFFADKRSITLYKKMTRHTCCAMNSHVYQRFAFSGLTRSGALQRTQFDLLWFWRGRLRSMP